MKSIDANLSTSVSFPIIILLFLLHLSQQATANNGSPNKPFLAVSGRVTSANDQQPLQGVSVTVKGTNTGTATDAEGLYKFNNIEPNATLVFSIVGYQAMEVPVRNRAVIDVSLQVEAGQLMETIVTANAIRRDKRSLGYSAPVVRSDELLTGRNTSSLSALQGKVAGVNITSTAGAPNSSTRIVLRGGSSISGNNQALIVIDGVPIDNSDFVGGSDLRSTQNSGVVDPRSTVNFGNRGNDINPEDIESITVLKGPTAAALYGSRASNGAVVITTKSGRKGQKTEVTVSSTVTFSNVLRLPQLQNGYGQGYQIGFDSTGHNEYYNDPIENWSWGPPFTGEVKDWGQEINGKRLQKPYAAEKDNIKDFFETGRMISNTVSFAGSGEKTTFYLSLNSLNSDGVMPYNKDAYNRYNVRFNGTSNFTNNFSASISLNYSRINSNLVQGGQGPGSPFDNLLQTARDIPIQRMSDLSNPYFGYNLVNSRGEPAYGFYAAYTVSPYYLLQNYRNENDVDRVIGNFTITYKPLKWLNIVERIGADVYADRRRFKYPKFTYYPIDETTGNYTRANVHSEVGQYEENNFNVSELVHDLMITAKKDFGSFTGSLMVGHNLRQRTASLLDASTNQSAGLIVPGWYNFDNSNGPLYNFNEFSRRRLMGLYGQLTLGYQDLIFLDLTGRNDWSSTLPVNNRSFFYPSASASFVFSELMKNSKIGDLLSYGKIRASIAQVGNDALPFLLQNYFARPNIQGSFGSTTFPFNGVAGITRYGRIGNPNLKPEITTAYEAGAELNFFSNRLYLDFSVYKNRSKDQILTIPISESSGFTSKVINGGIVENRGIELSVRGTPIRTSGGFSLELYGTYTRNRNKVVDLQQEGVTQVSLGGLADMAAVAAEGKAYGTFYGVDIQHDDQGHVIVDPKTGIPLETPGAVYFGSYNPKYLASLGANIRYKAFAFNILFDRKSGGQFVSRTKDIIDFNGTAWETAEHGREPYVFPNSVYLDAATNKLVANTSIKFLPQDYFSNMPYGQHVLDASYVKLREVSLTYKLPKNVLKSSFFGDLTVGIFGNNLVLWTPSQNKYVDPEINSAGATNLQGFDFTAQPSQRNYGFNISASF